MRAGYGTTGNASFCLGRRADVLNPMDITGRLAGRGGLVTGGSRGIGAEIVRRLAAEGADVAFTYLTGQNEAEQVAGRVRRLGRRGPAPPAHPGGPAGGAAGGGSHPGAVRYVKNLVNKRQPRPS